MSNDLDALLADRPDVGVVLVKVDQTGQPRTPSRKFKSTVYGKCLLLKENSASPIASIPKSSAGQESTLQGKLTTPVVWIAMVRAVSDKPQVQLMLTTRFLLLKRRATGLSCCRKRVEKCSFAPVAAINTGICRPEIPDIAAISGIWRELVAGG